jgi:hypothetical protein
MHLISCIQAEDVNKSFGYFDDDDFYVEMYFKNDSIYVCNAAIPFINIYKFEKINESYDLYENAEKIKNIRFGKINGIRIEIFIDNKKYNGFKIEDNINLSYYFSNEKQLLDEFSKDLLFRKQKFKSLR